jgi:hypothetical protein
VFGNRQKEEEGRSVSNLSGRDGQNDLFKIFQSRITNAKSIVLNSRHNRNQPDEYPAIFAENVIYSLGITDGIEDSLVITIDSLSHLVNVTATPNFNGLNIPVMFSAVDTSGDSDSDTTTISVISVNDAPFVAIPIPDTSYAEDSGSHVVVSNLNSTFKDVDSDTLSFTTNAPGNGMTITVIDSTLEIEAAQDSFGVYPVIVSASDGELSAQDTFVVTIVPVNDPPMVFDFPRISFPEDSSYQMDLDTLVLDIDDDTSDISWNASFPANVFDKLQAQIERKQKALQERSRRKDNRYDQAQKQQRNREEDRESVYPDHFNEMSKYSSAPVNSSKETLKIIHRDNSAAGLHIWTKLNSEKGRKFDSIQKSGPAVQHYSTTGILLGDSDSLLIEIDNITHLTTITATPNFFGLDIPVIFTATDTSGTSDADSTTISIVSVNDPPVISGLPDSIEFAAHESYTLNIWEFVNDIETADSLLSYQFVSSNDSLIRSYENTSGNLTLSAIPGFNGIALLTISVSDDSSATAEASVIVHVIQTLITFNKSVNSFWNLLGLPSDVLDPYYLAVFPNANEGTLFGWNGSYFEEDTMNIGKGYWLRFPAAETVPIQGFPVTAWSIDLLEGWNMISGPSCDVALADVIDPGNIITPGTLYGYDGSYFLTDTIKQGTGYWLRANSPGTITLTCGSGLSKPLATSNYNLPDVNQFSSLVISDAAGFNQTLYFNAKLEDPTLIENYSLPPVPPAGSFDIRFAGDYRVTDQEEALIHIQSTEYPLSIQVSGLPVVEDVFSETGYQYVLQEIIDNQVVKRHSLMEGQAIEIADSRVKVLKLIKDKVMPAEFMVSQNYPNPFNPVTTIRYAIPQPAKVEIIIYNIMGQKIKMLVSEQKEAGFYKASWDGTSDSGYQVASGIYFYRVL